MPDITKMPASDYMNVREEMHASDKKRPPLSAKDKINPSKEQMPTSEQKSSSIPENDINMPDDGQITDKKKNRGK